MKMSYDELYDDIVREDEGDIQIIGENACKTMRNELKVSFAKEREGSEPDFRIPIVIFAKAYEVMLEELTELKKEYTHFEINFANRFIFGFENYIDDDDEKEGNFMVYIYNIDKDRKNLETEEDATALECCKQWNDENIIETPEMIRKISQKTIDELKKYDLTIVQDILIPPVVAIVYDEMVKYIKQKRVNEKEFETEINFANCFFIASREYKDGEDSVIVIRPSIEAKLAIKDDASSALSEE